MKRLLFFLAGLILFCNCKKEDPSRIVMLVTTNDTLTNVKPGDDILFHIHSSAVDDIVKNVTITSSDVKSGSVFLLDTLLNLKECKFDYHYIVPDYKDTMIIELVFDAFSSTKLPRSSYKTHLKLFYADTVVVNPDPDPDPDPDPPGDNDTVILLPHNGLVFDGCGYYDGQRKFFNLENHMSMTGIMSDSSLMDIVDVCGYDTIELSREWESYTGILFARFPDLDFDNVSGNDIVDIYKMAIKHTSIQNIREEDIILIGRKDTAIGVLRITSIRDFEMRYIFDLRELE